MFVSLDGDYFLNWENLYKNQEIGRVKTFDDNQNEKIEEVSSFNKYINKKNKVKKVFVSYSHVDSASMKELSKILKGLERNGQIEKWTDLELESGVEVKKEILTKLEEADIVILLISQSFIASDFIYDNELPLAMMKKINGKGEIIPVYLEECSIFDLQLDIKDESDNNTNIKMGNYYFSPQDENNNLKPINEWGEFKNKAWMKIYNEIKKKL
ncbi:TIR domain-containing protein [Flavobacterium jejuense]|uniref:TIR domain-containing protein n=1 Tax=Flavobacterium jejuense TaxID=1544455 RepID=A0ABX0ISR8_9FLAO|nr:toll/interleukin-1 receptor domain-containing protein [Flavobacterium jejuense]NHN25151.1 TIR domain-containing protein [Flavobacterium jejuense]